MRYSAVGTTTRRTRSWRGRVVLPGVALMLALGACSPATSDRPAPAPTSAATASPVPLTPVVAVGAAPVTPLASRTPTSPATGPTPAATGTPTPASGATPTVGPAATGPVSYGAPVLVTVQHGVFTAVQVTATTGGQELDGDIAADGRSWVSQAPPRPATAYRVTATVTDDGGASGPSTTTFTVPAVPDDQRLGFTVTPDDGRTVGIGQPIVVRFLTTVTERAAIEKVMRVTARTKAGAAVEGSWSWLSGTEVHWRPKDFWTPGSTVTLDMRIAGVQAAARRWGRKDYSQTFTIGASHVTQVDAVAHRVRVYRDGKLVDEWLGGTGRKGLETYSGTYIVLGKAPEIVMDSCSARITCDTKDPDYYKEKEFWATRITASGTFLHAASWDGLLGRANVSHGCVHLSDADAEDFYAHAVIGDVVVVRNTGRGPQERIATQDPGLYDWNVSWSKWLAGSALR